MSKVPGVLLCGAQGTYITASYSEMLHICVALAILTLHMYIHVY